MGDPLKDATLVLFSLALLSGFASRRAEHAIVRELKREFRGGEVHARVKPVAVLGMAAGQADTARVWGRGVAADRMPFHAVPGGGFSATVRRLNLDFTDITLRGTPVRRFTAELPAVSLAMEPALMRGRVVLRGAGEGTARAEVDSHGLELFLTRKFKQLKNVRVTLRPGEAQLDADVALLGPAQAVEAIGKLEIRDGRYIFIVQPRVQMSGKPLSPAAAEAFVKTVNPVMDIATDLGLGEAFHATRIEIGEGIATVHAVARVPRAPAAPAAAPTKEDKP